MYFIKAQKKKREMNPDSLLIFFLLLTASILSSLTTYLLFKRKGAPGAIYFSLTTASSFVWIVGYIVEFLGTTLDVKMSGVKLQYFFGIPFISTLWFAAAIHYSSFGRNPSLKFFLSLIIIPFVIMILMWTNEFHHLVYGNIGLVHSDSFLLITKEIGVVYYINIIYSYAMLLVGTIILTRCLLKSRSIYRGQIVVFIVASILPWIGNILYILGMNSFMRVDITPIAFSITMLLVWTGLFRYQLFDIVPIARNLIIESMQNAILVIDENDRIVDANPAARTVFNSDNLIGKLKDEMLKGLKIKWDIDNYKQEEVFEVKINDDIYELVVSDVIGNGKTRKGKFLTFYNITERKINEKKLKNLNASKDRLFSIIAHDLKNPFFGMIGLSDILRDDFDDLSDDEKRDLINDLNDLSRNTHKMLENLLDWSRQQTGKITFAPQSFDLIPLINQNINIAEQQARIKKINLISELPETLKVFADENMIDTVVRNLISNAIKFTMPGGKINVIAEAQNNKAIISVKDSGVGMTDEIKNKLFQLDVDVRSSGTSGEQGTGLGLLLCKEFIEKNKGTINVESVKDSGSTFTFTLPIS
jgi:signal transduction histidine kinase